MLLTPLLLSGSLLLLLARDITGVSGVIAVPALDSDPFTIFQVFPLKIVPLVARGPALAGIPTVAKVLL